MAGPLVATYLELLDDSFDGDGEASLLANLGSVTDREWLAMAEGGGRSIAEITWHVGDCYYMYHEYAFGPRKMSAAFDDPLLRDIRGSTRAETLRWLGEGYDRFRGAVEALREDELDSMRPANWGQEYPARWHIAVMIRHGVYHAGEINHLRARLQGDDRWAWDEPG